MFSDYKVTLFGVSTKTIVINRDGKLLTLLRGATAPARPLTWDFSGGDIDGSEDPFDSARREVLEETGIVLYDLTMFDAVVEEYSGGDHWLCIAFVAHVDNPEVKISWEHDDYKWVTKEEFLKLKSCARFHRFVGKLP
jgi:8-oxo-dGTP diphosphatase